MQILIATRNRHKFAEITAILGRPGIEFLCAADVQNLPEVDENGATFDENARIKACTLALESGILTLADDSGLEVDALGGAPGVVSARFAGIPSNDRANNTKLLQIMAGVVDRRARFRCVIALAIPKGDCRSVEGRCEGFLRQTQNGNAGFGYDPLFVPDGYTQTFAELDATIKNRISHRAQALTRARDQWREIVMGTN